LDCSVGEEVESRFGELWDGELERWTISSEYNWQISVRYLSMERNFALGLVWILWDLGQICANKEYGYLRCKQRIWSSWKTTKSIVILDSNKDS